MKTALWRGIDEDAAIEKAKQLKPEAAIHVERVETWKPAAATNGGALSGVRPRPLELDAHLLSVFELGTDRLDVLIAGLA